MLLMFGMEPNYRRLECRVMWGWPKEMFSNYSHAHEGVTKGGGRWMIGWWGGKDDLLPFVCDVTGAQAAVLLMAAI